MKTIGISIGTYFGTSSLYLYSLYIGYSLSIDNYRTNMSNIRQIPQRSFRIILL